MVCKKPIKRTIKFNNAEIQIGITLNAPNEVMDTKRKKVANIVNIAPNALVTSLNVYDIKNKLLL